MTRLFILWLICILFLSKLTKIFFNYSFSSFFRFFHCFLRPQHSDKIPGDSSAHKSLKISALRNCQFVQSFFWKHEGTTWLTIPCQKWGRSLWISLRPSWPSQKPQHLTPGTSALLLGCSHPSHWNHWAHIRSSNLSSQPTVSNNYSTFRNAGTQCVSVGHFKEIVRRWVSTLLNPLW